MLSDCRHHFIPAENVSHPQVVSHKFSVAVIVYLCIALLLQFCIRWKSCGKMPFFTFFFAAPPCKPLPSRNRARWNKSALIFFTHHFQYKINDAKQKKKTMLKPVGKQSNDTWHIYYRQSCNLTTMMPPLKTIDWLTE